MVKFPVPDFSQFSRENSKTDFQREKWAWKAPEAHPGTLMFISRHAMVPHYHSRSFPGIVPLPSFPGNVGNFRFIEITELREAQAEHLVYLYLQVPHSLTDRH